MVYKATLGTTSTLITIGVTILLGSLLALFFFRATEATEPLESIIHILVVVGIAALYLITWLYRPVRYTLDATHFVIKRGIRNVKIPISEINDAFIVRKESMKWTERVGGNWGLFGFYGNFTNDFGRMTWYATKLRNFIMIETVNEERIVVTPDNTEMVKEIRKLIGKSSGV